MARQHTTINLGAESAQTLRDLASELHILVPTGPVMGQGSVSGLMDAIASLTAKRGVLYVARLLCALMEPDESAHDR